MKIKSAKSFRNYVWQNPKGGNKELSIDYNFVGSFATVGTETKHGFFKMYHGIKEDIAAFLPSLLKIAEDGQAIYEFLQNAVDCNSTHFYIFYNDKYFLAINNGNPFDILGLQSVLNIAQTTKKSCDKIGRFGIGFKLVHRLVGKNEGVNELVNNNKGPILFSWSRLEDLQNLRQKTPIITVEPINNNFEASDYVELPYLMKLLLTNFPAEPNETIKNIAYQDCIPFEQKELDALSDFLNENFAKHSQNIDVNTLQKGTMFFLELGEGKKQKIDKDYDDLKTGVQYSMNTLKKLQKVFLADKFIEKETLELEEFEISKNSDEFIKINPEYKECNIKVTFGYYKDYKLSEKIKNSPNFYKYFPMGDETNGFNFIIHCDSFSNEANRRKLQQDDINKNLFPEISKLIINKINEYKNSNREQFLYLYASFLLSDIPTKQNNEWLKPIFYDNLLSYLQKNIPTKNNKFSDNAQNVKINNLDLDFEINLADFGLEHIQWFEWERGKDAELVDEAKEKTKLGLATWDIENLVIHANSDKLNAWLANADEKTYNSFLDKVNYCAKGAKIKNRLCEIKLFKFISGVFYSFNDVKRLTNVFFTTPKIVNIKNELAKLEFVTSLENIATYKNICTVFEESGLYDDKEIYKRIAEKCKTNSLTNTEKQRLFQNFTNEQTKFTDIGYVTLLHLSLFCNTNNEIKPLKDLVDSNINTPDWLNEYKIKADENFPELKSYLIAESELYEKIIFVNWASIIPKVSNILEFYQKVKNYYSLKENMASLADKATIYTNEGGFRKYAEVFYNPLFDTVNDYDSLQNLILKAANLPTPQQNIRQFLSDEKSPFKVTKNQKIKDVINTCENLDYQEVIALLEFAKLNQERIFDAIYIQKQGEKYSIEKHNQGIFQYHSDRNDVIELLATNNNFKLLPNEFKSNDFINLGLLQKDELHTQILNQGFEDCGKVQEIATKIRIFGKYKISELNEQDDVNFTIDEKNYKLKLSVILPKYAGASNIANEVIEQFKGFKTELKKHFFTQASKDNTEIYQELLQIKQISNIEQFAFVLFQSKFTQINLFSNFEIQIENVAILNYCFNKTIDFLRAYTSNFEDFSLGGKIYPSEFALDSERLPSWVCAWLETDAFNKSQYLAHLGVSVETTVNVLFRKFFKTNEGHENIEVYFANISNPQFLSNTLLWLQTQNITFNSSETVKLDYLRKIYEKISFTATTPLLYVQKIVANDITYNLETTTVTKYYYTENQFNNLSRIFEILQQKNCKLLAFAEYFEKWKSITNAIKIEISYPLDIEKLNQNSKEWQAEHYKKWKETNNYKIFVYDGDKIPCKIIFLNELVKNYTSGTDNNDGNDIYFCKSVENQIEILLSNNGVGQDALLSLLLLKVGNGAEVQSLQSEIAALKEENERLRNFKHNGVQPELTRTANTEDFITGYSGEAFVYEKLKNLGYTNIIWENNTQSEHYEHKITFGNKEYKMKDTGKPYDMTFDKNGKTFYLEVKSSTKSLSNEDRIAIVITKKEWQFLEKQDIKDFYYIARVFDVRGTNPEMKLLKVEFQQQ